MPPATLDRDALPTLYRDRSFWGMTATQFFGAFNDNLFKQLVLLLCVDYTRIHSNEGSPYQSIAQGLFAFSFVLFSGFAGFLSDRHSKRTIVVECKIAEIVAMAAGVAVFLAAPVHSWHLLMLLMFVLFFMGTQSAFFGPAKYGILPEMLNDRDLPAANGIIQMTTFLSIIFGTAAAGFSKKWLGEQLWIISAVCVVIAVVGTLTSLFVRRTPIAEPDLRFSADALVVKRETWRLVMRDRPLLVVLLVSSLFWFIGGVVLLAVNDFGKLQLGIDDFHTSLLLSVMGVGIALGCVLAGKLSRNVISFRLVTLGAWGMAASLAATSLLAVAPLEAETIEWGAFLALGLLGLFGGFFAVPLQVFLQARPPADQKGRMIGAMNLVNWIAILASAGFYYVCSWLFPPSEKLISWTFLVLAVPLLPLAIWYRPRDEQLAN